MLLYFLKKGIPATFFINSQFVDNQDLFFRYKASLLVDHLSKTQQSKASEKVMQKLLEKQDINTAILEINYQNKDILDQIADHLEVNFGDFLDQQKPYLSKAQIKNLIAQGFTIGSHSIDHPLYESLALDEQIRQTSESQAFVNQLFEPAVKAFAFPFSDHGVSTAFFQQLQHKKIIDLSFGTAGLKQDSIPFHLQRFPVEAFPFQMHELVSSEYFYYFGKSFLGKNKIKRT